MSNYPTIKPTGGDDTQLLQTAFDKLNADYGARGSANACLELVGAFHVSDTLRLLDKYRVHLRGLDAHIIGETDKPLLDMQGSTYLSLSGVHLTAPNAIHYGRGVTGHGGGLSLENMMIEGDCVIAQADTSRFERVTIAGKTTLTSHHNGIYPVSTHILNDWRNCKLLGAVSLQGQVQNIKFDTCYFANTEIAVTLEDHPDAGELNQVWHLSFVNCEAENISKVFLRVANTWGLTNLHIQNLAWTTLTEAIIEVDTPSWLRDSHIWHISKSYPATETFKVIQGALENVWYDGVKLDAA